MDCEVLQIQKKEAVYKKDILTLEETGKQWKDACIAKILSFPTIAIRHLMIYKWSLLAQKMKQCETNINSRVIKTHMSFWNLLKTKHILNSACFY